MLMLNHLIGFGVGDVGIGGIDAFTKLMLHFDGADASTTFTDSSASAHTVTAVGNAQIDTAQSKFGGASGLFDGTGDYLTNDGSSDFAFGTGDWTIDFWIRSADYSAFMVPFDFRPTSTNGNYPELYIHLGKLNFYVNSADRIIGTATLSTNTWIHIAVARSGTSTKMFVNGTQDGSTYSDSTNYLVGTSRPSIGAAGTDGSGGFNGWIDELRISKGVARWTSNFTPPDAPYSA